MRLALALFSLAACAQSVPDHFYFEPGRLRVLILSGRNNHDWRSTTPYLRRALEATGRFDVRVTEEPQALNAETLRPYDVLVSNYGGPRWGAVAERAIEDFVRNGKGLVVVHAASYPFGITAVLGDNMRRTDVHQEPWTAWGEMVGATWGDDAPRTGHAQRHAYKLEWQDRQHPIAAGCDDFLISDELYQNFRLKPGNHVLGAAFNSTKIGGTGKLEPLIWTRDYGNGRVFHTALGHDVDAMNSPGFVSSYARGVEWAASKAVTLPARIELDPKNADALRVLVVAGGHDHAASFYGVFEGWREARVNIDPHPAAFRGDLRKSYDVVVLYDTIQTAGLSEKQRANLKDFVEAGKGLVVLHHALADFQDWEWWWKDVVGGRYVLKGEGASSYKHDVELVVTPVAGHPIVKGLAQMRLLDETYKNVWHRPDVRVLLTTDEATSDKEIAWISPYDKSRVVVIGPGHGPETHNLPWYHTLVRRAVIWAGGR
jgi:type 1 glutamine amidotransferase